MAKNMEKSINKKLLWGAAAALALAAAVIVGILLFQGLGGAQRLKITPQEQTLAVGDTVQLKLTDEAAGGKAVQAQWRSDAPSVVTVDQKGTATAVAPGNARVTASVSIDGAEYTAVASLTVTNGDIAQLSIDGAAVPNVERQFLISEKTANVTDFPIQGIVNISDAIKDTCMVFAADKGTDIHSDAWELTGTIAKADMAKTLFMSFGVIDENGKEQWFCILDECMSLQRYWNWWDTRYEADGTHVAVNQVSSDFFFGKRSDLSFKIVVKDDIFRAYFGTSPDSVRLSWELPLTEEKFGGFAEGGKYQLAINTVDPNNMVIKNLKTVTGDGVEFDSQKMPGPSPNLLSVWDGKVSFKPGTGIYTMGEGDATAMTPKTYKEVELSATFCPDVWPIQGFAVKQGDDLVTFRFGSEGYDNFVIRTAINGVDGPFPATAFDFSLVGAFSYEMKMTYDGEYINFFTQRNGKWACINMAPISLADLLGESYDPEQGVSVGIAGFNGCGRQFKNIRLSGKVTTVPSSAVSLGPLSVHSGNVVYDSAAGMYIMGDGNATALTRKAYTEAELSVTFCPNTWPIQGFAVKQGDHLATFRFGSEGYDYNAIRLQLNGGTEVSIPTSFGFSLYGTNNYEMKLTFDGEYINLLTNKDGVWVQINRSPISVPELLGSSYDATKGICVGIAGFDNCGRQFRSVAIADKVTTQPGTVQPGNLGPLPVHSGEISYDSVPDTYFMGAGDATAVTDKAYREVDLTATFCPDVWPIQGFAMKQGDNMVTVKFGSEGYNASQVMIYKNGTLVSTPTILHEFSLYGAHTYEIKLIYKNGEAWLYFMRDGQWTQLSKYPMVLGDILGSDFDAAKGIAVGIAGFEGCGRQIKNVILSESVTLTPQLGLWDHYGVTVAELRAQEYAAQGENGVTTVFVGDSFMDPAFWTTFLSDMSGREALCLGIGGSTAEDWLGYLDEEIFLHNISPKNIVFNLGNNDLHNDGDLNVYLENMKKLLKAVHELTPGSRLFMFSVAHRTGAGTNGIVDQANAQMQQWCGEQGWVTFVNISDQLTTDMLSDGIHPQTPYYRSIFLPTLEAAGCEFEGEIVEIESLDVLPVHSGNVTFNENTGMYTMGTAVTDNPTAMTQKAYTEVELTATFCPNTWPVQGFAVKQGSNTVGFKFGSEGYDTHHIITFVNGASVAVNPATAFQFSLVGAYSYDMKLSYADGIVNMYLKQDGTWKQINASPIALSTIMSGFDNSYGVSVGIAGWGGCGRQFSNVAVSGTEGTEAPSAEAKPDILSVHSGNMTFDAPSGNYNVPSETGGSAMTAETYTTVELKTDYFNANWPIMGFQVGNGTDTVAFRFCSNEYDYWSLAVLKNGTETGSSIPSGSSTLWANTKYTLVMTFDGTHVNIYYENADGSRTKVNTDPIALADYLTYDTAVGISVGVYCENTWGTTTFSNVELTQNIAQKQDILPVHSGSMTFDAVSGNYTVPEQAEGSAMTAETYTAVELKTDYINGNWPIMGFQVGNGTDTVTFRFCSNEYDYYSLAVLKNGAETGSSIPSGSSTLWANTKYTLVMSFDGTNVNIYYENADGSRTKVNTDPIALADHLSYDAAEGICVGVYCGTGWGTTTFSNVKLGEVAVQKPDVLSVRSGNVAFDPTTGTYSIPEETEGSAMTAGTYTAAELKFSYVNRDWPVMGIQVGSGSSKVAFRFGSCGFDETSLAVLVNGAADGRTIAATNSSLFANITYNFVMVFDGTNINLYYEDGGTRTKINNEPIVLADYLTYDAAQGICVGVYCGADWGATTISNVKVSKTEGATLRSPAEPEEAEALPVSDEQEINMSMPMDEASKTEGATLRSPAELEEIEALPVSDEQEKIMSILMDMEEVMHE